jgi:hypothetical protein
LPCWSFACWSFACGSGGLEKLCHPGLGAELGAGVVGAEFADGLVAGSCANATTDAASKLNAMK